MKRFIEILLIVFISGTLFSACTTGDAATKSNSTSLFGGSPGEGSEDRDKEFYGNDPKLPQRSDQEVYTDISTGYASWYGKEMQGKPTASGELFDMNKFTGAHRTFPIGSLVLVRNLENGKKHLVRINDRGPYVEGRIIDVSYAVARELGFVEQGVARVEVELIEKGNFDFTQKAAGSQNQNSGNETAEVVNNSEAKNAIVNGDDLKESGIYFEDGASPKGYTVRTGAFKIRNNALRYREELEDMYQKPAYIGTRDKWNYVWLGDFPTIEDAQNFYSTLKTDGLDVMNPGKVQ